MATRGYFNFVRQSDVPTAHPIKRIYFALDKIAIIYYVDTHRQGHPILRAEFDWSNSQDTYGSKSSPNGFSDIIYRYMIEDQTVHLWFCVVVPDDTAMPAETYQEIEYSTPLQAIFLAEGETGAPSPPYADPPFSIPVAPSETEKKAVFVNEIKALRAQFRKWIVESVGYTHFFADVTTHLDYWLNSADYYIRKLVENKMASDASETIDSDIPVYDWLILAAICREAQKGPRTLDPNGDGSYNPEFFQAFKAIVNGTIGHNIPGYATGPDFGIIWTQTWDLTEASDATRVPNLVQLLAGKYDDSGLDRTIPGFNAATYDPLENYWS